MKKLILSSLLLFLLSNLLSAAVTVDIPCKNLSVSRTSGILEFNTEHLGGEPGQPALPVFKTSLLLPPDADLNSVSFSIEDMVEKKLSGEYEVLPALPPKTANGYEGWPDNTVIENGRDVAVYKRDAIFPSNSVKSLEIGKLSCFKLVTVEVNQFRYNPVTKALYQMESGELKVDYSSTSKDSRNISAKIPTEVVKRLKRKVSNADEFLANYRSNFQVIDENGLVIVIPADLKSQLSNFNAFVESKESMGYDVQVLTDSDWGGGTGATAYNNIRTWLQNNYQSQGINYLLIIGSVNISSSKVPMHFFPNYAPSSWPYQDCDSDYGYMQLDGSYNSDYSCELNVGRIPNFSGASDIDAILQKTINYTNATAEESEWRYNALLGGPGYDASSLIWNPLNQAYHNWIEPNPAWSAWRVYGRRWSSNVIEADVAYPGGDESTFSNEWKKQPFGLVSWGTHGSPTYAENVMSSSLAPGIGNDYPSFVICGSCTNAHSRTNNNLSYSMLKYCAMGAMAGTRETAISEDMVATKYFIKDMVNDSMTMGQMINDMNNNHSNGWYNRAPMCIYGDPTIGVYSFRTEPFISVSKPVENEEYIVDSDVNIKWSTNTEGSVTIKLIKGQSEVLTIASNETNDKEYSWSIPESVENGNDYVIKITADGITGESDAFTIKQKPSIVLGSTSFDITLSSDKTKVEKLNIKNEGAGGLNYNIKLKGGNANLLINEIFTPYNEFIDGIEIWNRGTECDLKGYTVKWTDNQETSGEYTFDESFILGKGETMVLADAETVGKMVVVDVNLAWSCTDDLTEISVSILDPDGNCVEYIKTAGSTDTPPANQWTGAGIPVGSQRLCRKNNDDSNSASDWTSAEGEESINEINDGQSMEGVGKYWLTFNPESGTVSNLSNIDIDLTFDSYGLTGDEFMDTLIVTHDDPDTESPIFISCKLTIGETSLKTTKNMITNLDIFNVGKAIKFQIPEKFNGKNVRIDLFNLQGKIVKTLINGKMKSGIHTISILNRADKSAVASGLYLCRMKTDNFTKTINMNILK